MKIKTTLKKLTENLALLFLPFLMVFYVRLIGVTLRYNFVNTLSYRKAKTGGNCIFVFWHQKLFAPLYSHRNSKMNIMVSQHRDGELAARTLRFLGYTVTRGSTTRGGMKACLLMRKEIERHDLVITPDGPRGPRYHFSGGPVTIAKFSGRPILPVGIGARFAKYLSSWDRFMLPLPTSRINIVFGRVHYIKQKVEEDAIKDYLAKELNELNRVAEVF